MTYEPEEGESQGGGVVSEVWRRPVLCSGAFGRFGSDAAPLGLLGERERKALEGKG